MIERDRQIRFVQGASGDPLAQIFQHHPCDIGQLETAGLGDRVPFKVGELAVGNRDLVNDGICRDTKEARIEPPWAPGGRNGARKER